MRGATVVFIVPYSYSMVSIHAPHAGRDWHIILLGILFWCFNPRAPCGARHPLTDSTDGTKRFNPRAPCGARPLFRLCRNTFPEFQSTRPMRGATSTVRPTPPRTMFQSTRPMRGATLRRSARRIHADVSIHAPHAGRDPCCMVTVLSGLVSIHAPHAGRDDATSSASRWSPRFNPRAPCGARRQQWSLDAQQCRFNPRAPCGARRRAQ